MDRFGDIDITAIHAQIDATIEWSCIECNICIRCRNNAEGGQDAIITKTNFVIPSPILVPTNRYQRF